MKVIYKSSFVLVALAVSMVFYQDCSNNGIQSAGAKAAASQSASTVTGAGGPGYDGVISVSSSGVLVNGAGFPIELRGSNMPMDSQIMSGWTQPFGVYAGAGGPPWATYASWKPNVVRITVNVGAWLNLNMGVFTTTSTSISPSWSATKVPGDPALTYKAAILSMIKAARSIGSYVIIDAHWSAPAFTFNSVTNYMGSWGQPLFIDYDTGYPYWAADVGRGPIDSTGIASTGIVAWLMQNAKNPATGNINDIIFELFNEPYLDGETVNLNSSNGGTGAAITKQQLMLNGGWVSGYCNQDVGTGVSGIGYPNSLNGPSGQANTTTNQYTFNYWWRAAGYQQILNGIRSLGASNVILVNGLTWSSDQSTINQVYPTDSLMPPQIGTGWHIYESAAGGGFPGTGDTGSGTAAAYQYAEKTINGSGGIGHPIPIIITEYGNATNTGSGPSAPQPDPYMVNVHSWMDAQPVGSVGATSWSWPQPASFGSTATDAWTETILGPPISFTASFNNTTMTVTTGSNIQPGLVLTSGAFDRSVVLRQLTGSTGGTGTYEVSISQTAAPKSVVGQMWLPNNGQGMTEYNWMVNHR